MGSGLPGSLPSYLLYYIYLYISYLANKIVVVATFINTFVTQNDGKRQSETVRKYVK